MTNLSRASVIPLPHPLDQLRQFRTFLLEHAKDCQDDQPERDPKSPPGYSGRLTPHGF